MTPRFQIDLVELFPLWLYAYLNRRWTLRAFSRLFRRSKTDRISALVFRGGWIRAAMAISLSILAFVPCYILIDVLRICSALFIIEGRFKKVTHDGCWKSDLHVGDISLLYSFGESRQLFRRPSHMQRCPAFCILNLPKEKKAIPDFMKC